MIVSNGRAPRDKLDFTFENHLSVTMLTPLTDAAREWLEQNVSYENYQLWGHGIAIEPRYAQDLHDRLVADGLVVDA
jgi:hypothetical protein